MLGKPCDAHGFGRSLEPVLLGLRDWGEKYKRRLQRG
jgi:hypothetical protein